MSGQQRGERLFGQRGGAGVAEHGGEGGVGVDENAVESGGEHGCGQSVQQYQRRQLVEVSVRGARRGLAASFGDALLHVHELVVAVAVGSALSSVAVRQAVWWIRWSAKSGDVVIVIPSFPGSRGVHVVPPTLFQADDHVHVWYGAVLLEFCAGPHPSFPD